MTSAHMICITKAWISANTVWRLIPNSSKFTDNRFRRLSLNCDSTSGLRLSFSELAPEEKGADLTACLASGEALEQAFDSGHAFAQIADVPANFAQAAFQNAPKPYPGARDGQDDCDCLHIHDGRLAWESGGGGEHIRAKRPVLRYAGHL